MKQLILLLLSLFSAFCYAENRHVFLLIPNDMPLYREASNDIVDAVKKTNSDIDIVVLTTAQLDQQNITENDLIVPIGEAAIAASQKFNGFTVLYSLIERQMIPADKPARWAAIVIDQPISRLFAVAEQIVADQYHDNIVVAVSETNQQLIDEILALDDGKSRLRPLIIRADQQPAREIDKVLFEAGALIAVRDDRIWSGENAKWMLYQSFKYQVPVIGYSKKFLNAGALASVYVTLLQTTNKTVELILDWQNNQGQLSQQGVVYPDYNIEFNEHIARSLNFCLPPDHDE